MCNEHCIYNEIHSKCSPLNAKCRNNSVFFFHYFNFYEIAVVTNVFSSSNIAFSTEFLFFFFIRITAKSFDIILLQRLYSKCKCLEFFSLSVLCCCCLFFSIRYECLLLLRFQVKKCSSCLYLHFRTHKRDDCLQTKQLCSLQRNSNVKKKKLQKFIVETKQNCFLNKFERIFHCHNTMINIGFKLFSDSNR